MPQFVATPCVKSSTRWQRSNPHRSLAPLVQHNPPTLFTWLSAASTMGFFYGRHCQPRRKARCWPHQILPNYQGLDPVKLVRLKCEFLGIGEGMAIFFQQQTLPWSGLNVVIWSSFTSATVGYQRQLTFVRRSKAVGHHLMGSSPLLPFPSPG